MCCESLTLLFYEAITTTANLVNIKQMAVELLDKEGSTFSSIDAMNYGCAGRAHFDPFSKTLGKQVDQVDKAFYKWKKCIQCASTDKLLDPYQFDLANQTCGELLISIL